MSNGSGMSSIESVMCTVFLPVCFIAALPLIFSFVADDQALKADMSKDFNNATLVILMNTTIRYFANSSPNEAHTDCHHINDEYDDPYSSGSNDVADDDTIEHNSGCVEAVYRGQQVSAASYRGPTRNNGTDPVSFDDAYQHCAQFEDSSHYRFAMIAVAAVVVLSAIACCKNKSASIGEQTSSGSLLWNKLMPYFSVAMIIFGVVPHVVASRHYDAAVSHVDDKRGLYCILSLAAFMQQHTDFHFVQPGLPSEPFPTSTLRGLNTTVHVMAGIYIAVGSLLALHQVAKYLDKHCDLYNSVKACVAPVRARAAAFFTQLQRRNEGAAAQPLTQGWPIKPGVELLKFRRG